MNTTDDGMEPVGENPEVGVLGLIAAADKITAQAQAVQEIRELHREIGCRDGCCKECRECSVPLPCDTIAILDRHGL